MKHFIRLLGLFVGLGCVCAWAQPNFNEFAQTRAVQLYAPANAVTGTAIGDPIDVGDYGGVVNVWVTITSSNSLPGTAHLGISCATAPTNAAAAWLTISNASIATWTSGTITTNLATGLTCTNNFNYPSTESYTSPARATIDTNANVIVQFGIPVRENNRYWKLYLTNDTASMHSLSAWLVGRKMSSN